MVSIVLRTKSATWKGWQALSRVLWGSNPCVRRRNAAFNTLSVTYCIDKDSIVARYRLFASARLRPTGA